MLPTLTPAGLHAFTANVVARYAKPGTRLADLGAGPGAMGERLQNLSCDIVAADRNREVYQGKNPFVALDLNHPEFATQFGNASFDLVLAVEVIEHLENPISFLRNVARLLRPRAHAVLTTPNVDSLPSRLKFLLSGKIRMMDEHSDPTHISPIFFDLFHRQFLPLAGLRIVEHLTFPANGYQLTRKFVSAPLSMLARALPGVALQGDHHVFVLAAN